MRKLSIAAILGFGLVIGGVAQAENPFLGKWEIKQEFQGQERISTLTLAEEGGTWATQRGTNELSDLNFGDNVVTFTRTINRQGQEFTMECKAAIVGEVLVGTMTTPRGEREFTATRVSDKPTFVGQWTIEMDFQGRQVQARLDVMEADGGLKGKWSSQRGDADLNDVAIKDDTLTWSRTMEREGQEFTMDYSAKLVDGKLDGTISTVMGDMPFVGTRVEAETQELSEAMQMLKAMDANGDGKVSEDESPEQMKQFFSMIDSNGDGGIDEAEMQMVVEFRQQQGQ